MQTLHETHDVAREVGESESKVRRLARSGVIEASHVTKRGTLLFSEEAVAQVREKLEERKAS